MQRSLWGIESQSRKDWCSRIQSQVPAATLTSDSRWFWVGEREISQVGLLCLGKEVGSQTQADLSTVAIFALCCNLDIDRLDCGFGEIVRVDEVQRCRQLFGILVVCLQSTNADVCIS